MRRYKFVPGLENVVLFDYVTEKFNHMFATGRLPVYWGAPNAASYAPLGSFINALEYSPQHLATLLKHLDVDDEAYKSCFRSKLGANDSIAPYFNHLLGDNEILGKMRDGMDWVCKVYQLYHKYYDWNQPGQVFKENEQ